MELIEGRWEIVSKKSNGSVLLRNIYNNRELTLSKSQYLGIVNGKITIGRIMKNRLRVNIGRRRMRKNEFLMELSEKLSYVENSRKKWQ